MSADASTFTPGPTPNTVRAAEGNVLAVPEDWVLLPPGDAALTRRVKAAGEHWVVAEKKGRRVFSRGSWAAAATIDRIRADLEAERSTEGFARRKAVYARRRERTQAEYAEDFFGAVVAFLAFHSTHADLANRLARAVTDRFNAGGERHRRPDRAHPRRTTRRGRRYCMDEAPDDCLRIDAHSEGEGKAPGKSGDNPLAARIARPLSPWRIGPRSLSAQEGTGDRSKFQVSLNS